MPRTQARTRIALTLATLVALRTAAGCGASDDEAVTSPDGATAPDGSGAPDGGDATADAVADGAPPSDADAGEPAPTTDQYDPCASGDCWTAPALGACGSTTIDESYSSGLYNVHRYLLMLPAGVGVELTAKRSAGSYVPVLLVHDEQGTTVFDGMQAYSTSALSVSIPASPTADTVSVHLEAPTRMSLAVFATSEGVVSSGFSAAIPTDAKYSLEAKLDCTPPSSLTVRGVKLGAREELWVRTIAEQVVPKLPGTASERLNKGAVVAWWALKEGVLDVGNALSYSNCSMPPDQLIGPVEVCPNSKNAWQVGLSGVQVTGRSVASVEAIAKTVFPSLSPDQVLENAGIAAGIGAKTSLGQTISTAQDRLRVSWLLRSGPVGFEAQYPTVQNECFVLEKGWCFGTGWTTSANFAPTRAGAEQSIADLEGIFQSLAP